jgi:hypothetical protein
MTAQITATVENGVLKLDKAQPFPDQTRVKLTIEPVWNRAGSLEAWQRLKAMVREKPLFSGGLRVSREELYDRD